MKEYLTSRKIFSFAALEIFSFLASIFKISLGNKLQQNVTQGFFFVLVTADSLQLLKYLYKMFTLRK